MRTVLAAFAVMVLWGCGSSSSMITLADGTYGLGEYGSLRLILKVPGSRDGAGSYEIYGYGSGGPPFPGMVTENGKTTIAPFGSYTFMPTTGGVAVSCQLGDTTMACSGPPRAYDQSTSLLSGQTVSLTLVTQ